MVTTEEALLYNGVDWFAVLELAGAIGAAAVTLWLASRRLRPALHCHSSLATEEHLGRIAWKVDLSNRSPIGICLVRGDLYWLAPTWRRPWARGTYSTYLPRVEADDYKRKPFESDYPVELAGYASAQLWVSYPRSDDFVTGPTWRRWLAYRSIRLVLQTATGERFMVKLPKGWEPKAPLDPHPRQTRSSAREPGTNEDAGNQ